MIGLFESFGLTQNQLQLFVVAGIATILFGVVLVMFWHYIVAGAIAVFCVMVFANPIQKSVDKITTPTEKESVVIEMSEDEEMFMEDCTTVTEYSVEQCRKLWAGRMDEEKQILKESI